VSSITTTTTTTDFPFFTFIVPCVIAAAALTFSDAPLPFVL
jgi:hypothetical protein